MRGNCALAPLGLRIISPLTFYLSFLGVIWTYDKKIGSDLSLPAADSPAFHTGSSASPLSSDKTSQQRDDDLVGDEKEPYEEAIFGHRRPDSMAIDWNNKMVYILEFKRTSDQRKDYREKGEARAKAQHDVLISSYGTMLLFRTKGGRDK